jgi:hypothetical protein
MSQKITRLSRTTLTTTTRITKPGNRYMESGQITNPKGVQGSPKSNNPDLIDPANPQPIGIGIGIPPQTYQHSIGAKILHLNRPTPSILQTTPRSARFEGGVPTAQHGLPQINHETEEPITSAKPPQIEAPEHRINLGRAERRSPWLAARPTNGMRGDWGGTGTGDGGGERRCNATTWTREPRPLCFWVVLFQLGRRSVIKKS